MQIQYCVQIKTQNKIDKTFKKMHFQKLQKDSGVKKLPIYVNYY